MTRGNPEESWIVGIIQEREVVGDVRRPRIYAMHDGTEFVVVWSGEDRALLPEEPTAAVLFKAHSKRWERKAA